MENTVHIKDKDFDLFIRGADIRKGIDLLAVAINNDLQNKNPLFLCVLNGAFMFAADLMKKINIECGISFIKLASYRGTSSSGEVRTLVGLDENIKDRVVVIVEDIVDTGNTIEELIQHLRLFSPAEVRVATLLLKPDAYRKNIKIDYAALRVPNDFIIGYGLDYDGYGRNYEDIYKLVGEK